MSMTIVRVCYIVRDLEYMKVYMFQFDLRK